MAGRLAGKVAVITGAASGIGRATVDLFIAEGARVIAADVQEDKGAQIEHEHKDKVSFVRCDVMAEADIASAVKAAKDRFGRLDILFNNAGTGGAREMPDGVTAEGFDSVMHLHVRAALFGMKYAIPIMREQGGGSIISTASIAGLRTGYGPLLYSIAKAAIIHMTHAAAAQLGPENIRVNCICPGPTDTPLFASQSEKMQEALKNAIPMKRVAKPSEVADGVLFFASDRASFVTGQVLSVSGGLTMVD